MEKRYRSLYLSDEPDKLLKAKEQGMHIVPCLPFVAETIRPIVDHPILAQCPYILENAAEVEDSYLDMIDARLCHYPLEILRTDRCIVREIAPSDLEDLYAIYKDPEITRYMEDLYEDPMQELSYIRDYIKWHYGIYGFGMWIITDPDGNLIGRAGFEQKEEEGWPQLGFLIRKEDQKKGLAFEVCSSLLAYMKEHYRDTIRGFRSFCHRENTASRRLLEKLGFTVVNSDTDKKTDTDKKSDAGKNPDIMVEYAKLL